MTKAARAAEGKQGVDESSKPVADGVTCLANTSLPMSQRNDSKYIHQGVAVGAAETLLYKAAVSLCTGKQEEHEAIWTMGEAPLAVLYRTIRGLKLPSATLLLSGRAGEEARGQRFGMTANAAGAPRIGPHNMKSCEVVRIVARGIREVNPEITFSSLQVIFGARALLYVGKANIGASMAIALGP